MCLPATPNTFIREQRATDRLVMAGGGAWVEGERRNSV